MKKVIILSASPKKEEQSVSAFISSIAKEQFSEFQSDIIDVRQALANKNCQAAYQTMREADALLIVFPLYFFCLPGMLMRFLEDYAQTKYSKPQKVYAIVNCGFPEPEINEEALRVVQSFSHHIGASFRFGIGLGSGGMILMSAKEAPFIKKFIDAVHGSLKSIAKDIADETLPILNNVYFRVNFPRRLYYMAGNMGWRQLAKKNGLKKRELCRKPYHD